MDRNKYDKIQEVEKFNPFHDAAGKFSNKHGFASYSANPNTKAGAMAIARSAAAGHGATANVHRESYGENIQQNASWMGSGKNLSRNRTGYAYLRNRVERLAGTPGASRAGASWQQQNQAQGRTTGGKKTQQQATNAATKPAAAQPTKPQTATQKPAQQTQQQATAPKTNVRQPVDGKDISQTFKYRSSKKGDALDQVTEQQGFKGKPQLIKDRAQFSAAVKDSGIIAYRTIDPGTDTVTGKRKTAAQFVDDLKNSDTISHNGTGGKVYGGGIYIASNSNPKAGTGPSRTATNSAKNDSKAYGGSQSKTATMTLDKSAKIGDFYKVDNDFANLTYSEKARYGNNMAAYAASLGYDGLRARDAGWNCDYITVYNRTKLIIFDD